MSSGVETRVHVHGDGSFTFQRVQDVEAILDANKRAQVDRQKFAGSFRQIASIPAVLLEKWLNEEGANPLRMCGEEFELFVKKKLRDPNNAWLRTTPGRI